MPARNSNLRYGYVAQTLHWVIVGLLIVQVTLGKIADGLPLGFEKLVILARHKSFGITILGLAVIRLAWRWISRPPPLPPMPRWQHGPPDGMRYRRTSEPRLQRPPRHLITLRKFAP